MDRVGRFNPRSRMGSDPRFFAKIFKVERFNPRSRMGSDLPQAIDPVQQALFQSTFPHGERPFCFFGDPECVNENETPWSIN